MNPVPPGQLEPCGEDSHANVREFFAHPDDIPDLLANGIRLHVTDSGERSSWNVRLTSTPFYPHGVQIQAFRAEDR